MGIVNGTQKVYNVIKSNIKMNDAFGKIKNGIMDIVDDRIWRSPEIKKNLGAGLDKIDPQYGGNYFKERLRRDVSTVDRLKTAFMKDDGSFSKTRIAGTAALGYGAVNVPYRFLSGGGITNDSRGNSDLIGVPFI